MNKFYFCPKNEYEFKQRALDAGRTFTEIRKDGKTLDMFERKINKLWKGPRTNQVMTHSRVRNAKTKEPLYSGAEIYSWIPESNETLKSHKFPDKSNFIQD